MSRFVVWMIHCYQTCLSPLLGSNCRFAPSCSCYAAEAITKHGVIKGSFIGLRRICRCHPFNPGGYDPVP